jgi:hypothetical protein
MNEPPDLPALHLLDSVFSDLTGHDLYYAHQMLAGIKAALAATPGSAGASGNGPVASSLPEAVALLRARLRATAAPGAPATTGFAHWDAAAGGAFEPDSLWSRAELLAQLKSLARYREAMLLVSNFRTAFCPPGARWTRRRQARYRESLAFLAEFARQRTRASARLTVLVA